MAYEHDLAVFIGRFEPFHIAHKAVVDEALRKANKVAIIIGSANAPRSHRNPFTYEERERMIRAAFPAESGRIITVPLEDTLYNDEKWVKDVQAAVLDAFTQAYGAWHPMARIALIGHSKDNSSFYLKLFPQWKSISVPNQDGISATSIRDWYFGSDSEYFLRVNDELHDSTKAFLREFQGTKAFEDIRDEYEFVATYKRQWANSPFPPVFVTVDAVVVQSGHVLLVQRGARPGKGQWALPGGFLNQDEWIEDAVLRELKEETKIKVPVPVLRGNIVASRVFDDPYRSSRGRTITHAYLIQLPPDTELPRVKGSDDAAKARWVPLAEVRRDMMFEDHFDMVQSMTDLL
jgi:bifunctional NMN adenylyltransferase/nudix hydrolase